MIDKVWLTDAKVGTRFGTTRQWVWVQARTNPNFPHPLKSMSRWSRWSLREIEELQTELLKGKQDQYYSYAKALAKVHLDMQMMGGNPVSDAASRVAAISAKVAITNARMERSWAN